MYERREQRSRWTRASQVTGKFLRLATSAASTYTEALTVWDLMEAVTEDVVWQGVGTGLVTIGLAVVNYYFWLEPVERNVAAVMIKLGNKCAGLADEDDEEEREGLISHSSEVKYKCPKAVGLSYVSLTSSIASFAMFSSTIRYALMEMTGYSKDSPGILIVAYISGGVSVVYAIFTEIWTLWCDVFHLEKNSDKKEAARFPALRTTSVCVFVSNYGGRTWLSVFVDGNNITTSTGGRVFIASIATGMGMVINFCFQGNEIIANTPVMRKIEGVMTRLPKKAKVVIIVAVGVTTVWVNGSLTHFNVRELMDEIFNKRLHRNISDAGLNGSAVTSASLFCIGDVLSEIAETGKVIWTSKDEDLLTLELVPMTVAMSSLDTPEEDRTALSSNVARSTSMFGLLPSPRQIVSTVYDTEVTAEEVPDDTFVGTPSYYQSGSWE